MSTGTDQTQAAHLRPFTRNGLIWLYAKSTVASLVVGLICFLIAHFYVYVPLAWTIGALGALATFRAVMHHYVVWDKPLATRMNLAAVAVLVAAALATG